MNLVQGYLTSGLYSHGIWPMGSPQVGNLALVEQWKLSAGGSSLAQAIARQQDEGWARPPYIWIGLGRSFPPPLLPCVLIWAALAPPLPPSVSG